MRKALRSITAVILALAMVTSGAYLISYLVSSKKATSSFEELAKETEVVETVGTEGESIPTFPENPLGKEEETTPVPAALHSLEELTARNPDCIGWITVPGTCIDYPLMQTKDEPEYYLHHDFQREYSEHGVPFLDAKCSEGSGNLILYGHNKYDGTMFTPLVYFPDREVMDAHKEIILEIGGELRVYEVFAAFSVDAAVSEIYRYTMLEDQSDRDEFLKTLQSECPYELPVSSLSGCDFTTLSTCDISRPNGRIVVVGATKRKGVSQS